MKPIFFPTTKGSILTDIIQHILKTKEYTLEDLKQLIKRIEIKDIKVEEYHEFEGNTYFGIDEESPHYIKSR